MIKKILKKLLGFKNEDEKESFSSKATQKLETFFGFFSGLIDNVAKEISTIREKCNNLRETNYKNGLYHLEKGHLKDAIFRFRFIKKFWPDLYDAYYQLAYCLILNQEYIEARQILTELLEKKPDFDNKARDLLEHLNSSIETYKKEILEKEDA